MQTIFGKFFFIEENSTAAKILEHAEAKAAILNAVLEAVAENVAEDGGVVEDGADAVPVEPPKKKLRRCKRKTTSSI